MNEQELSKLLQENLRIHVDLKKCSNPPCGLENSKFKCCGKTYYCGKTCQSEDFFSHKRVCEKSEKPPLTSNSHEFYNTVYRFLFQNGSGLLSEYLKFLREMNKTPDQTAIFITFNDEGVKENLMLLNWKSVSIETIDLTRPSKVAPFNQKLERRTGDILIFFFDENEKNLDLFKYQFEKLHGFKPFDDLSKLNSLQREKITEVDGIFFRSIVFMNYVLSIANWEVCTVDVKTKKESYENLFLRKEKQNPHLENKK